jgi:hypothetical protein
MPSNIDTSKTTDPMAGIKLYDAKAKSKPYDPMRPNAK